MTRRARCGLAAALLAVVIPGCRFAPPDYDGTEYQCLDGVCPAGYTCVAGECEVPAPPSDAAGVVVDAPLPPADAAPLTLIFGESSNADVTGVTMDCDLSQNNPNQNFGINPDITVTELPTYEWRGLLRFDLSAIPASATVLSAELHLVSSSATVTGDSLIYFYEVTEEWQEGTANGANGAASWNLRLPLTPWTAAGAALGSHSADIQAEVTVHGPSEPYTVELPSELVQRWVDGTALNHGLMLNPVTTTFDVVEFESSEANEAGARPWLAVTFLP